MIGEKFWVEKKSRIVEALSEPYVKKYSESCDTAYVVVKFLDDNSVDEGSVMWLESVPTIREYNDWDNGV